MVCLAMEEANAMAVALLKRGSSGVSVRIAIFEFDYLTGTEKAGEAWD